MLDIVDNRAKPTTVYFRSLDVGDIFQISDNGIYSFKVERCGDVNCDAIILNGDQCGEGATFHEKYVVIGLSGKLYIEHGDGALPLPY